MCGDWWRKVAWRSRCASSRIPSLKAALKGPLFSSRLANGKEKKTHIFVEMPTQSSCAAADVEPRWSSVGTCAALRRSRVPYCQK
jgi:hypothetical protein